MELRKERRAADLRDEQRKQEERSSRRDEWRSRNRERDYWHQERRGREGREGGILRKRRKTLQQLTLLEASTSWDSASQSTDCSTRKRGG